MRLRKKKKELDEGRGAEGFSVEISLSAEAVKPQSYTPTVEEALIVRSTFPFK